MVWPNVGQADGTNGDLAMLAPPFIVTEDEIDLIVQRFGVALPRHGRTDRSRRMSAPAKITYTSASGDLNEFHHRFDVALEAVRAAAGARHPFYIGGARGGLRRRAAGRSLADRHRPRAGTVRGRRAGGRGSRGHARRDEAQRGWARLPWRERLAILRRAAALIRERKYELAAIMSLEVGKSRLEAMGDAEESADLIDYYCAQVEEADGFVRPMGRITPVERNTDVLRPYGVFACIAPFNFPAGAVGGHVVGGAGGGQRRGLQAGGGHALDRPPAVRGVPGRGASGRACSTCSSGHREAIGDALWQHPGVDGVVFTGSKAVGHADPRGLGAGWIKPCLLELGGKNAAIVMPSADLDAAAEGVMRSAFSLQNQKCSATSAGCTSTTRWPRRSSSVCSSAPAPCGWATRPSATSSSARSSTSAR